MGYEEFSNNFNFSLPLSDIGQGLSPLPAQQSLGGGIGEMCIFNSDLPLMMPDFSGLAGLFAADNPQNTQSDVIFNFSQDSTLMTMPSSLGFSASMFPCIDFSSMAGLMSNLDFSNIQDLGVPIARTDGDFDKMLSFILKVEGNSDKATKVKGDRGGLTKKGIIQSTYDTYRKNKGLSKQSVDKMTDAEMKDIYYNMYYLASGADKIKDARLALYVFDTAVNMGVGKAKAILSESGGNLNKFINIRKNSYSNIASRDTSQKQFLAGWNNRLNHLQSYAQNQLA